MFKWTLVFLSLVIVSLAVGCNKDGSSMFRTLNASGMGLGIHFGQSADDVHAVLGEADGLVSRQGGANVEDYYLSLDPDIGDIPSVPPDP
ncbi:hypothetical protein IIA79_06885, partial [bacterium]|nr:hypothetical protein [bacterium]